MESILKRIVDDTYIRVEESKKVISYEQIKETALEYAKKDDETNKFKFEKSLKGVGVHFIYEVKKASPSKGIIAKDFPYIDIAKKYEEKGASAISVLTEPKYFMGNIKYIKDIVDSGIKIPILRKDFVIDDYMIYEAKVYGASAILLIASVLDIDTLSYFLETAHSLNMNALVETHNEEEIKKVLKTNAKIIGVNNRNLNNFEVDLNTSLKLRNLVDNDKIFVSESGIKSQKDIELMKNADVNALLIGEWMMRGNENDKS